MILYYQNQVLRKQITLAEILNTRECQADALPSLPRPSLPQPEKEQPKIGVREMVENVLPLISKRPFWYSDIKQLCLEKHPAQESKIRKGIHPACHELIKRGVLIKVPGGFQTK